MKPTQARRGKGALALAGFIALAIGLSTPVLARGIFSRDSDPPPPDPAPQLQQAEAISPFGILLPTNPRRLSTGACRVAARCRHVQCRHVVDLDNILVPHLGKRRTSCGLQQPRSGARPHCLGRVCDRRGIRMGRVQGRLGIVDTERDLPTKRRQHLHLCRVGWRTRVR